MKLLHICNDYCGTRLYQEFFFNIGSLGCHQTVIAPLREGNKIIDSKEEDGKIKFFHPRIIRSVWDRLFFRRKTRKLIEYLDRNLGSFDFDLIHAHTLFSDGAVANAIFQKYRIPYIVAIRNTDVHLFLKYFVHLRKLGLQILDQADKVVFISRSYLAKIDSFFVGWSEKNVHKKSFIPNGINDFWLKNYNFKTNNGKEPFKLLFVGEFKKNKNIHSVIAAVEELRKQGENVFFEAVGLGRSDELSYLKILKGLANEKSYVKFSPSLDRNDLILKYRESDAFVMPSFFETFGLVYAEALSQGLPIIYTQKQGFDGVFPDGAVGYSVDPNNIMSIVDAIRLLIKNYEQITDNIKTADIGGVFAWSNISRRYKDLYSDTINGR